MKVVPPTTQLSHDLIDNYGYFVINKYKRIHNTIVIETRLFPLHSTHSSQQKISKKNSQSSFGHQGSSSLSRMGYALSPLGSTQGILTSRTRKKKSPTIIWFWWVTTISFSSFLSLVLLFPGEWTLPNGPDFPFILVMHCKNWNFTCKLIVKLTVCPRTICSV